jgi:CheY-like chemotaxis protein
MKRIADDRHLWHADEVRLRSFHSLMRYRIRDVLLVSSLYDSFLFEEDGGLYELIQEEYRGLGLTHSPELTRVSSGTEAIALAQEERRFDLIITTLHIEGLHPLEFASRVRQAGLDIPIVLLAFDNRELAELLLHHDMSVFDRVFIWQGDFRLIIAIINYIEDLKNVEHDTAAAGVQSILLIEDSIRFYSSFLPHLYTETLKQSRRLIGEGFSAAHRFLRMRARPKILLATSYEEAWKLFEEYEEYILGIISDIDFKKNGVTDPSAGIAFARAVKERLSDIPILLQSNQHTNEAEALRAGSSFVVKDSPTLLEEVRHFLRLYLSFGDFIFRTPDGREVGRARDLKELEEQLRTVPDESLRYHGERNHFSRWLKARTEFWLAGRLRPRKVTDYLSVAELRADLIGSLHSYRTSQQRGIITDFDTEAFDASATFARIGGGSIGGKARGLGFLKMLVEDHRIGEMFGDVRLHVPGGVVIGTEVFDRFLDENQLRAFALQCPDDAAIVDRFLRAEHFPETIRSSLRGILSVIRRPLAIRSSSLLEDSQYQPFAGVFETYMLPNNADDVELRLRELEAAIRQVYASTFFTRAKDYFRATPYRLEEEKMAVIIQVIVGAAHGDRFYPDFAGVARSYNFYSSPPQTPEDGIASVALGLGKTVVDGGLCVRFCPKYPRHLLQLSTVEDILNNNQPAFYALDLRRPPGGGGKLDDYTRQFPIARAEEDGTLSLVGSTYSPEDDAVHDGISRSGVRVVTFAHVLKTNLFHIPEVLQTVSNLATAGMGSPVEIEFAVTCSVPHGAPVEFGLLQMRPLVVSRDFEQLSLARISREELLCESRQVLGHGSINDVFDLVVVDIDRFERSKTDEVAREVGLLNARLVDQRRPYVLIGIGRWGTLDPWLGIPVRWDQISGAKVIVESSFRDLHVAPSQGSHFFQNLTAFHIGYFSVDESRSQGFVDWAWLSAQQAVDGGKLVRLLRFPSPLRIRINGHEQKGVILKPGSAPEQSSPSHI